MEDELLLTDDEMKDEIWAMGCKAEDEGVEITQALRFATIARVQLAKARTHYTKLMEREYERGRKDERERIYNIFTGQETRTSDKGNIWIRFGVKDWQALREGEL